MEIHTPAIPVVEAEDTLTLPAWSIAAESWYGQPRLRAYADISNVVPFSLAPLRKAVGANLMLCVAYRDGTHWVRYAMWANSLFAHLEVYSGERLGLNARFEFWTINASAPSLPAGISFGTGRLSNQDWRCSLRVGGNVLLASAPLTSAYDEACSPFFPA